MTETALQKVERMEHLAKLRAWQKINELLARGDQKTAEIVRINQLPKGTHINLAFASLRNASVDYLLANSRRLKALIRGEE